ncbi:MAG TPA: hypothetical protein VJP89_18640 [Pyrinomonadaceae bacterium]|nr:hypothetical protein [Pyrinomonadaceae bacterium]
MSSTTKNLFLLAVLTVAVGIAVSFLLTSRTKADNPPVTANEIYAESKHVKEAAAISADDEPQVVSLEVTPAGFQPGEVSAPRGKFLILLQNRTGQRNLSFYLIRENQERLAESQPQKRDWKAHVQLNPGTYIIGETNHPEWQFTLRVTN